MYKLSAFSYERKNDGSFRKRISPIIYESLLFKKRIFFRGRTD